MLTVTELLRERGVVGKFVEFYGAGLRGAADRRPRDDRQHVAGVRLDLRDLPDRRRDARPTCGCPGRRPSRSRWSRPTPGSRACGTTRAPSSRRSPTSSSSTWRASSRASPAPSARRTGSRCSDAQEAFQRGARATTSPSDGDAGDAAGRGRRRDLPRVATRPPTATRPRARRRRRPAATSRRRRRGACALKRHARRCTSRSTAQSFELDHGHVVIAAITSCTNTSNPSVMVGAGHPRAQRGRARPALQAVGEDLARARLEGRHRVPRPRRAHRAARAARLQPRRLRLHDLHRQLRPAARRRSPQAVGDADLAVVSVLSGNRNFEGRIHPDVKMNYLASPPLCVAYALAGTMDIDLVAEPLGAGRRRAATSTCATSGRPSRRSPRRSARPCARTCSARATARCSPATSAGTASQVPDGRALRLGRATRPTCAGRPTSRTCRPSPRRSPTSTARACSRCSATASRPTTSRRPARSSATARPAATCRSTASSRATSTPTARAAATTR